ncbi:MAG: LamG domain-containing protein [Kiritimatiellae bacterium]|nr:LamG domain-containing protein [Kiritimatiellia bacterium]
MKRAFLLWAAAAGAITAAAELPPGLVLRFTCDEFRENGKMLPDATGSNNNGRVSGAKPTPAGRLSGGCEFTGKNSSVRVPHSTLFNSPQMTFCLWFKTMASGTTDRTLLEKGSANGTALRIAGAAQPDPRKGKLRATVDGHDCFSDAPVADNAWHHAAVTYDGVLLKLHVDGAPQKQTVAGWGDLAVNTQDLTLGANRPDPKRREKETGFEGVLDEVMLFNRALTEPELKTVMAETRPKFTKWQVERRLKELKELLDRGLILQDFYERKVKECEVTP